MRQIRLFLKINSIMKEIKKEPSGARHGKFLMNSAQ